MRRLISLVTRMVGTLGLASCTALVTATIWLSTELLPKTVVLAGSWKMILRVPPLPMATPLLRWPLARSESRLRETARAF